MINEELKKKLLDFRKKRDWEKFHKPKDLAVSITIEAAELLEHFQWKSDKEVAKMLKSKGKDEIYEEIADIAIYLTYVCHDLGIDINDVISKKLEKNKKKYPAEKVRGSARKYSEYK